MRHERYFTHVRLENGTGAEARSRHQMGFLYRDIDFRGKTVLDIGGGTGVHSFFAIASGAKSATVIEPEGDGGNNAMIATFRSWRAKLEMPEAEIIETTLQAFHAPAGGYDVVLVQDAINHFDEPACIRLRESAESRAVYSAIFGKISSLLRPGGQLVMADCSPRNLFPAMGLRNPIDPAIEWHKHQPPSIWSSIARPHGLSVQSLRWSSPARFGAIGRAVFGNAIGAWFFTSHFVLSMRKHASSALR